MLQSYNSQSKNSFLKEMAFEIYGRYKYATYQIFKIQVKIILILIILMEHLRKWVIYLN